MPPLKEPWKSREERQLRVLGQEPEPGPEFPLHAPWLGEMGRRSFLQLSAATLALAGLNACTSPPSQTIVPYVDHPPEVVPGRSLFYATTLELSGYGRGVLVESFTGRPIHVEGNPTHPASLGAADVFMQSSLLELYDASRMQALAEGSQIRTPDELARALREAMGNAGRGVRVLTGTVTSPSLLHELDRFRERFPEARWHRYDPVARGSAGERLAFGRPVQVVARPERARVLVSFDEDFLSAHPDALRHARGFSQRRQPEEGRMSRLYVFETTVTVTGAAADHRVPLAPWDLERTIWALAAGLGVGSSEPPPALPEALFAQLVRDLQEHPGESLLLAGPGLAPETVALVHVLNERLRNAGNTVEYLDLVDPHPADPADSLRSLAEDLQAGRVETLLILGGNPVYTSPGDVPLGALLEKVPRSFHLGLREDETARACRWRIPMAHELEAWGDLRAWDGTPSPVQPLIAPLYGGLTAHEVLARAGGDPRSGYDLVREYWRDRLGGRFAGGWNEALRAGVFEEPPAPRLSLPAARPGRPPEIANPGMALILRPDPSAWDGRFTGNPWLMELPRPLTKLTWDNAALVAPADAGRLGLEQGDMVQLQLPGGSVQAPVWVTPGHPEQCVTLHLGYGRRHAGPVGTGVGFDAYPAQRLAERWWRGGLQIAPTGERHALVSVQEHFRMDGREIVVHGSLQEFLRDPKLGHEEPHPKTLYPERLEQGDYAWGMALDLSRCIGCNACVIACQSENNIPVVGKEQVAMGREMHWLHVDRYYEGEEANPEVLFQPRPCMHCENAPCELVCPVEATLHSQDGLNQMIYNRCVGTRYCSNNCPYKVRRFNFLDYTGGGPEVVRMHRNPEVTVRSRGVMEKCTYCVQRIEAARIDSHQEDRRIRDGEVRTACQQACPTRTIVFGDLQDPQSEIRRVLDTDREYSLLAELNTRPRTRYLGRVLNKEGPV